MSAQHTPLPWEYRFAERGGYDCMTDAIEIWGGTQTIAFLDLHQYGQERRESGADVTSRAKAEGDAALLVRAVNNHAALVAALEKMTTWAATYAKQNGIDWQTDAGPLSADVRDAKYLLARVS